VPVIIGGGGKVRTPRLAARYASEFNHMFAAPDDIAPARHRIVAACEAIDRDPATMTWGISQVACVAADEADLIRRAAAIGRQPDELRANGVAGTVDEAAARLALYAEHGITRVYLQVNDLDDLDHLHALAQLL
jgi:alkanesulfonate monooxygenase SsuD/methylene tetrahydromethanopterin reductase-like flavin-dependent oxidoreductase (luciferase family)